MPCGEHPLDCAIGHIAPALGLQPVRDGQWSGECPACKHNFSFGVGTKGRRFVWTCWRKPARGGLTRCTDAAILEKMAEAGISGGCISPSRGRHRRAASTVSAADLGAWVELPAPAIRLRLVMASLDCGPWEAAAKLGLSRSASYRAISPKAKPQSQ